MGSKGLGLEGASSLMTPEEKLEVVGMRGIAHAGPMALERLDFYEHMEKSLNKQIHDAKASLIPMSDASSRYFAFFDFEAFKISFITI